MSSTNTGGFLLSPLEIGKCHTSHILPHLSFPCPLLKTGKRNLQYLTSKKQGKGAKHILLV
jgi:hypothetical protein